MYGDNLVCSALQCKDNLVFYLNNNSKRPQRYKRLKYFHTAHVVLLQFDNIGHLVLIFLRSFSREFPISLVSVSLDKGEARFIPSHIRLYNYLSGIFLDVLRNVFCNP